MSNEPAAQRKAHRDTKVEFPLAQNRGPRLRPTLPPCRPSFRARGDVWGVGEGSSAEGRRAPQPRGFRGCYRPALRAASAAHAASSSADPPAHRGGGTCWLPAGSQGTPPGLRGAAERADSRSRYVRGERGRAGCGGQARAAAARALVGWFAHSCARPPRAPAEDFTPGWPLGPILIFFTALWLLRGCDL